MKNTQCQPSWSVMKPPTSGPTTLDRPKTPPRERGKYQGLFGGVFGLSSVVGPLTGGFITDLFGWHWVFFINLPVGALALAVIFLRMPALGPRGTAKPRLDLAGAACLLLRLLSVHFGWQLTKVLEA